MLKATSPRRGNPSGHPGEAQAQRAPKEGQEGTLRQQLLDQAPPAGPQDRTHRQLPSPGKAPGQKEVGHIHAGTEEHQGHRSHEDPERQAGVPHPVLAKGNELRERNAFSRGNLRGNAPGQGFQALSSLG